jgi:hypothetical protein
VTAGRRNRLILESAVGFYGLLDEICARDAAVSPEVGRETILAAIVLLINRLLDDSAPASDILTCAGIKLQRKFEKFELLVIDRYLTQNAEVFCIRVWVPSWTAKLSPNCCFRMSGPGELPYSVILA